MKLKQVFDVALCSLAIGGAGGCFVGWNAHEFYLSKVQPVTNLAQSVSDPVGAFQRWLGGQK